MVFHALSWRVNFYQFWTPRPAIYSSAQVRYSLIAMDEFKRLAHAVKRENSGGELPDFVVPLLMKVADNPDIFRDEIELVRELADRVEEYDPISNYCCEKIGYNLKDIHLILDRLRVSY